MGPGLFYLLAASFCLALTFPSLWGQIQWDLHCTDITRGNILMLVFMQQSKYLPLLSMTWAPPGMHRGTNSFIHRVKVLMEKNYSKLANFCRYYSTKKRTPIRSCWETEIYGETHQCCGRCNLGLGEVNLPILISQTHVSVWGQWLGRYR